MFITDIFVQKQKLSNENIFHKNYFNKKSFIFLATLQLYLVKKNPNYSIKIICTTFFIAQLSSFKVKFPSTSLTFTLQNLYF